MTTPYQNFILYFIIIVLLGDDFANAGYSYTAGTHCVNSSGPGNSDNQSKCISCFFPQNCLQNNTCLEGTGGRTCEKCIDNYRLGNTCIPCEGLPITTITFGFYLLLFMMAIITNGFTNSLCTKLKVVCHFFQMVYLTFLIKIQWPVLIQKVVIGLAFVTFNSNVIPIKCLIPSISSLHIHYLEWGSSFLIVVITILITVLVDRSLRSVTRTETDVDQNQKKWGRHLIFLRLVFFVMVMMYVPVALSVVHSSLCSGVIPAKVTLNTDEKDNVFFYLQDESCTQVIFQNLQFFGTLFLLFFVLLIPSLTVFVSLRQRRWRLLSTISQQYRPLYESYRSRCCFWEALPMLRKLLNIAVTDIYPFSVFVQCLILLSTTGLYFLLLILLRPYKAVTWGSRKTEIHTFFEIQSTLTIGLMQALPLLLTQGVSSPTLEYLVLGCIGLTTVIGLVMIFMTPMEKDEGMQISPSEGNLGTSSQTSHRWCNKVTPLTFEEEVELNRRQLEF